MLKRLFFSTNGISIVMAAICLSLFSAAVSARVYNWPHPAQDIILGENTYHIVKDGESYAQIAAYEDVAYDNLDAANPGLAPANLALDQLYKPYPGTVLLVPTKVLLPAVPHKGIVINVVEKRLYYFQPKKHRVYIYPIGVGRADWETPLGKLHIYEKIKNPVWIVPDSIMKYRQKRGDPINKIVQSGPDNPLGYFAMRLSNHSYLIHGTNEPSGVGRRSSAGCIRLYADDIKQLFSMVTPKTSVLIINSPFTVVIDNKSGQVFASFHRPFKEEVSLIKKPLPAVEKLFQQKNINNVFLLNQQEIKRQLKYMTGLPFSPQDDLITVTDNAVASVFGGNV